MKDQPSALELADHDRDQGRAESHSDGVHTEDGAEVSLVDSFVLELNREERCNDGIPVEGQHVDYTDNDYLLVKFLGHA